VHKDELDIAALGVSKTLTNALRLGLAVDHANRPQRMTEFQALLLGGGEAEGMGEGKRKPKKIGPRAATTTLAPRAVEPAPSASQPGQRARTFWTSISVVVIVIAFIAMCTRDERQPGNVFKDAAAPGSASLPEPVKVAVPPTPTIEADDSETVLWKEVKGKGAKEYYEVYLKSYPKGKYVTLANIELKKMADLAREENERKATTERDRQDEERQQAEAERQRLGAKAHLIERRYRDNGDGTVTDVMTKLQWMRCALGQTWISSTCQGSASRHEWEDADKLRSNFAGHSDWRLPKFDELSSLVYCSSGSPKTWNKGELCLGHFQRPTIVAEAFPNSPSSNFWSGSPYNAYNSRSVWVVSFNDGQAYQYGRSGSGHVRLVRGGQ